MEAFGAGCGRLRWKGAIELETGPAPHFRKLRRLGGWLLHGPRSWTRVQVAGGAGLLSTFCSRGHRAGRCRLSTKSPSDAGVASPGIHPTYIYVALA